MKKILAISTIVLLASFGVAFAGGTKVSLCHVTSSETNEFQVISISDSAYDTHIAHGDSDLNDDGSCGDNGGGDPTGGN